MVMIYILLQMAVEKCGGWRCKSEAPGTFMVHLCQARSANEAELRCAYFGISRLIVWRYLHTANTWRTGWAV